MYPVQTVWDGKFEKIVYYDAGAFLCCQGFKQGGAGCFGRFGFPQMQQIRSMREKPSYEKIFPVRK